MKSVKAYHKYFVMDRGDVNAFSCNLNFQDMPPNVETASRSPF